MLHPDIERKYIDSRIEHDAFAQPGTKGIISIEERPMLIPVPDSAWPHGLKPVPQKINNLPAGSKINDAHGLKADVLVITYTTDETRALSFVLTGDKDFESGWYKYGHGFTAIKPKIESGLSAGGGHLTTLGEGAMGFMLPVKINNKLVMVVKSELHPARNGKQLPFLDFVQQLVKDVQPGLVITAGTGGAVGSKLHLGDVVVTDTSMFLCKHEYPNDKEINTLSKEKKPIANKVTVAGKYIDYANEHLTKLVVPGLQADIQKLIANYNIHFVKLDKTPSVYVNNVPGAKMMNVISADYFSIDDTHNTEGLQALGVMNDMDDAFAAFAINQLSGTKPQWLSVRNASEPEIEYTGDQKKMKDNASRIYDVCGFHTSYNSSMAIWGIVAGL